MTDDIVTRLHDLQYDGTVEIREVIIEAADEIERLRKILRHVAKNNPAWADPDMECRTCNAII